MHLDVINLRGFYYRTPLGRLAQRAIRDQVAGFWDHSDGLTIAGFGFAAPLLRPFMPTARRVLCLMPAGQGVMHWPQGEENCSSLVAEFEWPVATGAIDRLIVMHGLETSDNPSELLDEIWRVLAPGGRVIFIVPNRTGIWARSDQTPFGYGRPYSLMQLENQLKAHQFYIEKHRFALYAPPNHKRKWRKMGPWLETLSGNLPLPLASGVILVEASKQVFAPTKPGLAARVKKPLAVIEGLTKPIAEPVRRRGAIGSNRNGNVPMGKDQA
ncbi:MAG: methyltransferase domain-containing protein [Pseudomonadota bacterium]